MSLVSDWQIEMMVEPSNYRKVILDRHKHRSQSNENDVEDNRLDGQGAEENELDGAEEQSAFSGFSSMAWYESHWGGIHKGRWDRGVTWWQASLYSHPDVALKGNFVARVKCASWYSKQDRFDPLLRAARAERRSKVFYPAVLIYKGRDEYAEYAEYRVKKTQQNPSHTHEYSLLPAKHTRRGRIILDRVGHDVHLMLLGEPIPYLALYCRDLLTF